MLRGGQLCDLQYDEVEVLGSSHIDKCTVLHVCLEFHLLHSSAFSTKTSGSTHTTLEDKFAFQIGLGWDDELST